MQPIFNRVTEQHAEQLNSRFRGNSQPPTIAPIPSQHFENPTKLILYLFSKSFFEPILKSTNDRIREKAANPDDCLVSMTELLQHRALDHLANQNFSKPTHMNIETWFKNINYLAKPHIGDKDLDIKIGRKRFDFISKHLDAGSKVMVDKKIKVGSRLVTCTKPNSTDPIKIYDLNHKLDPLIDNLNSVFLKYKNPNAKLFTLDESFRKSFSKKDRLRTFMPNKPSKFGQKFQSLCDDEAYVHFVQFDHSAQFSKWNGMSGLLDIMVPPKYKMKGYTVCCDNYYLTYDNLKMLHNQGVSAFGTFRKSRIGKVMGQDVVKALTKKVKKRDFVRKFDLYETQLNPAIHGNSQFIEFGFFWDKLDKVICFGSNDPRLFLSDLNPHKSKVLVGYEKPNMVHVYNGSKCHVDQLDKMMTEYTCVRPFRNGRCIRRFVSNLWDFAMNNAYVLFKNYYSRPINSESKYAKLLKKRNLRSIFYYEGLYGLIGYKTVVPELQTEISNCGPFPTQICHFQNPSHPKRTRTQFTCAKCSQFVCKEHSVPVCHNCYRTMSA